MKVDLAKRRRIMQRSQKLGHCICDPSRPCPCDVLKEQGICPCAGERPPQVAPETVKLTELVHNAGCASKIAPADLEAILARLPIVEDPAVLSGIPAGDDAGIYAIADGTTLVQTVDVFTPCVDDPYTFGRICAANCVSDIYAMGGVPRTALSILGFPSDTLDGQIVHRMLRGAMDTLKQADVALIGGHSIMDEEIKLGFAVTGTIAEDAAARHDTAKVGDALVLTKPLGVGVLGFCRQIGRIDGNDMVAAERSMATLNKAASEAMTEVGVSACTDVTGFGLFGHLIRMARHSGITVQIHADTLPAFAGTLEAIRDGVIPGAIERNREYVGEDIVVADGVEESLVHLGFDAQTSGGLLIAVPAERAERLVEALSARGVTPWKVGRIVDHSQGRILVTRSGQAASAVAAKETSGNLHEDSEMKSKDHSRECCAEDFQPSSPLPGSATTAAEAFRSFLQAVGTAGKLDERTKELISFALVVMARCGPCVTGHLARATKMGITREELDEAAWIATAIGGAPVRMFYKEAMAKVPQEDGTPCCG